MATAITAPGRLRTDDIFFPGMALLILGIVVTGFGKSYFLAGMMREKLPNALEVQLDETHRPRPGTHGGPDRPSRAGRTPVQLFGDYLSEQNVGDERVQRMFAELLEEMTEA